MPYYFSPADGGFYLEEHGDLPEDAVAVSQTDYDALFEQQNQHGKVIIADADGHPMTVEPPPSRYHKHTPNGWTITAANARKLQAEQDATALTEQLLCIDALEAKALNKIKALELSVKHGLASEADQALLTQWEVYLVRLSQLPRDAMVPLPDVPA